MSRVSMDSGNIEIRRIGWEYGFAKKKEGGKVRNRMKDDVGGGLKD